MIKNQKLTVLRKGKLQTNDCENTDKSNKRQCKNTNTTKNNVEDDNTNNKDNNQRKIEEKQKKTERKLNQKIRRCIPQFKVNNITFGFWNAK